MTQSNLPTNHHLKHLPSLAGLNSQRQVAHINDGTWTSKMMINTPNPYLAHWNQSQVPVPKHLQVEGGYIPNSATSSVKNIQGQTGQNLSTQGGNQANNGAFVQSQNLGPNATQQNFASTGASLGSLDEKTYKNMTGSILNQTRGLNLSNKDFPVILDGEVIIADGTVKPNYSRHSLTQFHTKVQPSATPVTVEELLLTIYTAPLSPTLEAKLRSPSKD